MSGMEPPPRWPGFVRPEKTGSPQSQEEPTIVCACAWARRPHDGLRLEDVLVTSGPQLAPLEIPGLVPVGEGDHPILDLRKVGPDVGAFPGVVPDAGAGWEQRAHAVGDVPGRP